jgi:3-phosphoshikimate 1-carboxyvinyltransferase
MLALLAEGRSVVENANPGTDCASTLGCVQSLGLEVARRGARLELSGRALELAEPDRVLECGNSGTTLRLLAGVVAGQPFLSVLAGDGSLNRRPVARIIEPLSRMGASLWARQRDQLPPLVVRGAALTCVDYQLPIASAQVASSVLLAGLQARGVTRVTLPGPARNHTECMLSAMGVPIEIEAIEGGGRRVTLGGPRVPTKATFRVPGDFSAAAFFFAAAAASPGASVTATEVSLNPTRTGFLDVLEAMGAAVARANLRTEAGEDVGDVTVTGPERLSGFDIPPEWVPRLLDEVPAWAVAAAAARGRSRLRGARELRVKESDRLAMLSQNLARLGVAVREGVDGIEIQGGPIAGGTVGAVGDHRIAMAFAVLGTLARGPVAVEEAENIDTSFPDFVRTLAELGGEIAGHEPEPARG